MTRLRIASAWQANDESRINDEVRMTRDCTSSFGISSFPSTFVIRISSYAAGQAKPWDCTANCRIDIAGYVLQHVPHFHPFRLKILGVVGIRLAADRHLFHHLKAVTFESDNFLGIVGQKTELADSEIEEDLRAKAVIAQVAWITEFGICLHRVESFFLQFVGVNFCREPDAAAFLAHINQNAIAFFLDLSQRRVQLVSTIAP